VWIQDYRAGRVFCGEQWVNREARQSEGGKRIRKRAYVVTQRRGKTEHKSDSFFFEKEKDSKITDDGEGERE